MHYLLTFYRSIHCLTLKVPTYEHVENLTHAATRDCDVAELLRLRRNNCFFFTFIRDPVDRYISGLYESHRFHPEEVNVTALTYAFAAASNDDLMWKSIDHRQNSIFNVGQLDYLRTRSSESPLSESVWDFVGRYGCPCPLAGFRTLLYFLCFFFSSCLIFFFLCLSFCCSFFPWVVLAAVVNFDYRFAASCKFQCMLTCVLCIYVTWLLALMPLYDATDQLLD